jgi:hypothetical protein
MHAILLEDIRNYSIVKKELLDIYNNKFELKEDILYFMNDFCNVIYGVSKITHKRMRRMLAFIIKEKKYISLHSLIINNDNHNSQVNRYIGCLNVDERNTLMQYIQTKHSCRKSKLAVKIKTMVYT